MRTVLCSCLALLVLACGGSSKTPAAAPTPERATEPPPRAEALTAAQAFVTELLTIAEAEEDEPSLDALAALVSRTGLTVLVGYESSDEDEPCPGECICNVSIPDPQQGIGTAVDCLDKNSVGFAPSEDQWGDWSQAEMDQWSWQIDASTIPALEKTSRLLVLHAPETLYVIAVVADDDGAARVAAVYSGMTYDE